MKSENPSVASVSASRAGTGEQSEARQPQALHSAQQPVAILPPGYSYPNFNQADDEIDLRELWNVIWQGKWLIIAITFVFAVGAVAFAITQPNIYKAEALLAPSEESKGGGLAALAGQFGGLASLAGVNLGGGGADKTAIAMEVIKSRQFLNAFIRKHELLVPLMAAEGWNLSEDKLLIDDSLYDAESSSWVREVKPPKTVEPSDWEAYKAFSEILTVSQDKTSGLVTVSIEHYSPYIAKQWAEWLVQELNAHMRAQDQAEAQRSIDYLTQQLNETQVAEMQTVFYQLIEEQTKTMMLSKVRNEYVFKTVDPAVVPEEKAKPKRALICVLGTILGGMLGVMIVLIRHFSKRAPDDAELAKQA